MKARRCLVYNFSTQHVDYAKIWLFQKYLLNKSWLSRRNNEESSDSIILVQHKPVYTLGRGDSTDNLRFSAAKVGSYDLYRVERGGEVTFHGPGQLIAYPIFDLNYHKKDLHWVADSLEQTVLNTLLQYNIVGNRSPLNAGVWLGNKKVSQQGVTASRWITMHGVAVNLNIDLTYFDEIVPCGIAASQGGVINLCEAVWNCC